jgi:subtilisin family serine protease
MRILVLLSLVLLGVAVAGDATAINLAGRAKVAGKAAPKAPFARKGPSASRSAVPAKGKAAPEASLPKGPAHDKGAASEKGPASAKGAPTEKGPELSKGSPAAKGPEPSKGPPAAKGPELSKGPPAAKGPEPSKGAPAAKGPAAAKSDPRGSPTPSGTAAPNRTAAIPQLGPRRRDLPRPAAQGFAQRQQEHRQAILATRSRLPQRPLPGERGFTGVPPAGETRFVSNEMVFQIGPNVSREAADAAMRRLGLTTVASQTSTLTGGTVLHLRVADGRPVADAVRALEAENIGIAQPNYVFRAQEDASLAARTVTGDPSQYVFGKLRLGETHRLATGNNVIVAVIDSAIDVDHPELAGAIAERFEAVGHADRPHVHGTGMAGAIAARRRLVGIAPGAKILAVHAFSPEAGESAQATTRHIIAGLEWAIGKGARVINMSFAGPYDPMLALAMKNAREKGVVLIAAAGNMGPTSPPLYPAADPNVIAVTATDEHDKLFAQANQGPHIAVAAPGVNIIEPAPNAGYQVTTGTSVAAAHVSGVAALMLERDPALDPAAVLEILTISAWNIGSQGHDDKFGWGLIDPSRALQYVDLKVALDRKNNPANPAAAKPGPVSSR